MAWDYAELSKAAKAAGGPEELVNAIEATAKAQGKSEMTPWIGVAFAAGVGAYLGITKIINHFKKKKVISQEALDKAKAEIVQGIKEYDATHPEIPDIESNNEGKKEDAENE